jgi:hypothetical protein
MSTPGKIPINLVPAGTLISFYSSIVTSNVVGCPKIGKMLSSYFMYQNIGLSNSAVS